MYAVIDMDYERGLKIIDRMNYVSNFEERVIKNQEIGGGVRNVKEIIVDKKH